jgi:dihydroorotase
MTTLIRDATLADGRRRDVRVGGERVQAVAERLDPTGDDRVIDATGKRLLPGMIDAHVHFRQPGHGHKETWATGSRSAAAGGVTTVVDQPNTTPPTVDGDAYAEKEAFAVDSLVDYGINGGVTADWQPDELLDCELFALGEVFLADSTGDMGIEEELFAEALAHAADADVPVTVHAEDAGLFNRSARDRADADAWSAYRRARAESSAVARACDLAADHDVQLHVAHASTPRGIDVAAEAGVTTEVTPHHMLLSRRDLRELETHGRMNPPLRREKHRQRVYDRVADGTVDMVATDHAPHTREEKEASIWEAPSGVPGVETALALLLAEVRSGDLTYERVRDLTATNPAAVFGLPEKGRIAEGYDADLVLVDPGRTHEISPAALHTNCEWTPFAGWTGVFPELTMVRGTVVYEREAGVAPGGDGERFADPVGRNVRASRTERGAVDAGDAAADANDDEALDRAIENLSEDVTDEADPV